MTLERGFGVISDYMLDACEACGWRHPEPATECPFKGWFERRVPHAWETFKKKEV